MSRFSRRNFLRKSLASLGATIAVPAFARPGAIGTAVSPDANDRIGLGHIGVGSRGSSLLGRYTKPGKLHALAVSDVDRGHLKRAVDRIEGETGEHVDYRELLDRKDIDAVVIAVPDHWHALCSVHACEAGADVYCEKPLSLTVRQGKCMVEAARRYARVFQTGSQQRSAKEFRRGCELVRSGRIGKVSEVRVNVWGTSHPCDLPAEKVPAGLDWERWLGPAPWTEYHSKIHPYKWRAYREFSGGTMTDWGAHHLDIAQWGLGMDASGPVEFAPPAAGEKFLTLRYENGVVVKCGRVGNRGVRFIGGDGTVTVDRGHFEAQPESIGKIELGASDVHLRKSPGHQKDWEECVLSRRKPICDVEIGYRSVTVCHLSNIALWTGRTIRWDPAKEEILGDEQASRFLDRPMRAPYAF